jgi:CelD/BcsL family acetyltransferase involved in cellulose biosynthesis
MLEVRVIESAVEVEALAAEWRDLLARSRQEVVQTPTWMLAWWRVFGSGAARELRAVTFRDRGRLVAIAPLLWRPVFDKFVPLRRLEFFCSGEDEQEEICSDYLGIVCELGREAEVASELARALVSGRVGRWDDLHLVRMSAEDPMVELLVRALATERCAVDTVSAGACPYITLPKTWDDYLASLDGQRRYFVRRSMRELETWAGPGGYVLRHATTKAELKEGFLVLRSLHGERWSEKRSLFESYRFSAFHADVMRKFFAGVDANLELMWLEANGVPIAAIYNILHDRKIHFYQSGRKLDVPKTVRPGIAVHVLAIRRAIEMGYREYDFLNGASVYKSQLALARRPLVSIRAIAPNPSSRAVIGFRDSASKVAAWVRSRRDSERSPSQAPETKRKPDEE